ncbi:rhomboid-like protein [Streptomyces sp. NPDC001339]|uniref:rhomboid-like protein n=1 Tax=Streptomyces sp. NPDC001339 TaxID=3364563 RepID=UPI0036A51AE7
MAPRLPRLPWVAPLYVGAVQLGAHAAARLPRGRRTELLRRHSTNVANLRAGRWETLVTSAAFVEDPLPVPYGAGLLAALGTAEARWGAARAVGVFAVGHIGASLLVYAGLRGRVAQGRTPPATAGGTPTPTPTLTPAPTRALEALGDDHDPRHAATRALDATARALDVGASYGFNATLGALAVTLPHRGARTAATAGLLALGIRPVLRRGRTFTDAGHLVAIALGVATGCVMRAAETYTYTSRAAETYAMRAAETRRRLT